MRTTTIPFLFALACLTPSVEGQGCAGQGNARLVFTPAILGGPFQATLQAPAGALFAWYIDSAPGSVPVPNIGTICLGATQDLLLLLDSASTGTTIPVSGSLQVPFILPSDPLLFGTVLYSQFAATDPLAPNGIALSTPASLQFSANDVHLPALGPMSTWRGLHAATTFGNGRYVLISGGGNGTLISPTPVASTDVYDHYTRTFLPGPPMAVGRVLHTSTLLPNGKILITGGLDSQAINNWADGEVFDPATGTFTPVANSMQNPRAGHTATLLSNGRVLITGGNTIFAVTGTANYIQIFTSGTSTTELYDPATNTFIPGPSLGGPRMGHEAVRLGDGRVLLVGGINGAINLFITALPTYANNALIYDPVSNSISSGGNMSTGRLKPIVHLLPSGAVLVTGGAAGTLLTTTNTSEIRSLAGSWSAAQSLPQPITLAATSRMNDGSLIIQGGGNGALANFAPVADVVRYVEGSGFQPLTFLLTPLMNHTLSPLGDGTFLLAGGVDPQTVSINTASTWTP